LIAYFIGNISVKNIVIRLQLSELYIASQRWDVFWDTYV